MAAITIRVTEESLASATSIGYVKALHFDRSISLDKEDYR